MLKLPAIPSHVAKVIAYAEGYGEWIVNALIVVAATVPTHNLSPSMGAALVVANRVLSAGSARLGQFITLTKGAGVGSPRIAHELLAATPDVQNIAGVVAPQVVADIEKPDAATIFDQVTADESALVTPTAPVTALPPAPSPDLTVPVVPESAATPDVPPAVPPASAA